MLFLFGFTTGFNRAVICPERFVSRKLHSLHNNPHLDSIIYLSSVLFSDITIKVLKLYVHLLKLSAGHPSLRAYPKHETAWTEMIKKLRE